MARQLLLASAALAVGIASACGGVVAEPIGGDSVGADEPSGVGRGSADDPTTASGQAPSEPGAPGGKDGSTGGTDPEKPEPGDPNDPGHPNDPGDPTDPNACFTVDASDVCSPPQTAKLKAAKLCASKGYELTGVKMDAKGHCFVSCCDAPSPPPPPPPPPGGKCSWTAVGDGSRCLSHGKLQARAAAKCAAQKAYPRTITFADDCPKGGARTAKVECCTP